MASTKETVQTRHSYTPRSHFPSTSLRSSRLFHCFCSVSRRISLFRPLRDLQNTEFSHFLDIFSTFQEARIDFYPPRRARHSLRFSRKPAESAQTGAKPAQNRVKLAKLGLSALCRPPEQPFFRRKPLVSLPDGLRQAFFFKNDTRFCFSGPSSPSFYLFGHSESCPE